MDFSVEHYTEEYFDSLSEGYIKGEKNNKFSTILELAGDIKGLKILDTGCGTGFISRLFIDNGGKVYSVDFSANALNKAREYHKSKLSLLQGDVFILPFKAHSFHIIVANDLIEHLYDGEEFLREVYRVLKPGGRFIINTDNARYQRILGWYVKLRAVLKSIESLDIKRSYWALIAKPKIFALDEESRHIKIYSPKELRKILLQSGFKVKKIDTFFFGKSDNFLKKLLSLNIMPFRWLFKNLKYSTIILGEK